MVTRGVSVRLNSELMSAGREFGLKIQRNINVNCKKV